MSLFRRLSIKKNMNALSAPALMTVFVISSLLVIFCFESVGLFNKEKNIELRMESIIPYIPKDNKKPQNENIHSISNQNKQEKEELIKITMKESSSLTESVYSNIKEKQIENLQNILLIGIANQMDYLENNLVVYDI